MIPTGKTAITPSETPPVPCGTGDVVLELGGSIGAAVIYTGPDLEGDELEIRPAGAPWIGTHVAVRERRLESGPRWAALFMPLHAGNYQVRVKDEPTSPTVSMTIRGGHIAHVEWPDVIKALSL
jgi:hypothetical protein